MPKRVNSDEVDGTAPWRQVTLGEVVELKRGYDLPRRERVSGSIPLVSSSGITDYHEEAKVRGPGVVTGRYGTLGKVFFVPEDFWPLNTTLYVRDFKGNDPRFIAYFLGSLDFSAYSDKAAVPGLNRNHLHQALVHVPRLPEQRAIAHILGTLDDKIELNRRMNETLEEMARALFKSWFVDFDPVRAKMEGRWRRGQSLPGMPAELYDLFPDRMASSELGEMPEGWEAGVLGNVANEVRVSVQPQSIEPGTPYIALEHMPKCCLALSDWGVADEVGSNKFRFERGNILFGKLRPYFHKVGIAPLEGVCSTDIVVVAPAADCWFGFVLGHISSKEFVDYTDITSTGTRMPRTKWRDMARYTIALPTCGLAEAFTVQTQPWVEHIVSVIHESRSLSSLRDTLLPGLVSGNLQVTHRRKGQYD